MNENVTNCVNGVFTLRPVGIWSLKRAVQSLNFDGAMMDKLTYAALKGIEADVSKVTVL